jgi:histidine triad (HIT) family protein
MPTACPFCAIVRGASPAAPVGDDPDVCAFLDTRPLFPGHVLVVPRMHYETITDAPPDVVATLFVAVRRIARAVEKGLAAEGTFLAVNNRVSQSVPHLHVHVVPRKKGDGLKGFFWPRQKYASEEAMQALAAKIREALAAGDAGP